MNLGLSSVDRFA